MATTSKKYTLTFTLADGSTKAVDFHVPIASGVTALTYKSKSYDGEIDIGSGLVLAGNDDTDTLSWNLGTSHIANQNWNEQSSFDVIYYLSQEITMPTKSSQNWTLSPGASGVICSFAPAIHVQPSALYIDDPVGAIDNNQIKFYNDTFITSTNPTISATVIGGSWSSVNPYVTINTTSTSVNASTTTIECWIRGTWTTWMPTYLECLLSNMSGNMQHQLATVNSQLNTISQKAIYRHELSISEGNASQQSIMRFSITCTKENALTSEEVLQFLASRRTVPGYYYTQNITGILSINSGIVVTDNNKIGLVTLTADALNNWINNKSFSYSFSSLAILDENIIKC